MTMNNTAGELPVFVPLNEWCRLSGMTRSAAYDALRLGQLKSHKLGRKTLIDVAAGLAWIRAMPAAEIAHTERTARTARQLEAV